MNFHKLHLCEDKSGKPYWKAIFVSKKIFDE